MTDQERSEIIAKLDRMSEAALTLAALYATAAKTAEAMR